MLDNFESEWVFGPADSHIFACVEIDATPLLAFIEDAKAQASAFITIDHVIGRAAAWAIERQPDINAHIVSEELVPHDSVDLLFITQSQDDAKFKGARLEHASEKTAVEVSRELAVRERRSNEHHPNPVEDLLDRVPSPLIGAAQRVAKLLDQMSELGPGTISGSALVMSVGLFGNQRTNAALSQSFQVPAVFEAREIAKRAVVVDDDVVVRPMLRLSASVDRRVIDRRAANMLMDDVRAYCASPWDFEVDIEKPDSAVYPTNERVIYVEPVNAE